MKKVIFISLIFIILSSFLWAQDTTETKAEENDINTDSLANYDEESANNAIMASEKLENDFISVYFNNYMR